MEKKLEAVLWKWIPGSWLSFRKNKMRSYLAISETDLNDQLKKNIQKEIKAGIIVFVILILLMAAAIASAFVKQGSTEIARNEPGEGESEQKVSVKAQREEFDYDLAVSEKQYTKKEQKQIFEETFSKLELEMKKGNKSLDHVTSDLLFSWELEGSPLEVKWEPEDAGIIDVDGTVYNRNLSEKTLTTHVKLTLSYGEQEQFKVYTITIYPRVYSGAGQKAESVMEQIRHIEEETRTKESFVVPTSIDKLSVQIGKKARPFAKAILLVIVLALLLIARSFEQEIQKEKAVRQGAKFEYSHILWQFVLLMEAGATVERAWEKIVSDYEERKTYISVERRYVYEQMKYVYNQMKIGCSTKKAFLMFGQRMGSREYSKLMTLFQQNITKGSKNMLQVLREEEQQAFLSRCEDAKRAGEEAETKLLLPMGIMLINVLLLLMIPAYLNF